MVSVFTVGKSEDGLREGAGDPEPGCMCVHDGVGGEDQVRAWPLPSSASSSWEGDA